MASASWVAGSVEVTADDERIRSALVHAFRRTPVVIEGGADRYLGTSGPEVLQPGDLEWFRAAAFVRAASETGLVPNLVTGDLRGGFDPASNYRSFEEQIERLTEGTDP